MTGTIWPTVFEWLGPQHMGLIVVLGGLVFGAEQLIKRRRRQP